MSTKNVFPAEYPVFKLRGDFAAEIGMLEIREPVSQEEFDELCAKDPTYRGMDLQTFNRKRSEFGQPALPHFTAIYGALPPHGRPMTKWISTTDEHFEVEDVGLWKDMLHRIAVAHGYPLDAYPIIYPPIPSRYDSKDWGLPHHCLIHDTSQGIAAVVPWKLGKSYLALNVRSKG